MKNKLVELSYLKYREVKKMQGFKLNHQLFSHTDTWLSHLLSIFSVLRVSYQFAKAVAFPVGATLHQFWYKDNMQVSSQWSCSVVSWGLGLNLILTLIVVCIVFIIMERNNYDLSSHVLNTHSMFPSRIVRSKSLKNYYKKRRISGAFQL